MKKLIRILGRFFEFLVTRNYQTLLECTHFHPQETLSDWWCSFKHGFDVYLILRITYFRWVSTVLFRW